MNYLFIEKITLKNNTILIFNGNSIEEISFNSKVQAEIEYKKMKEESQKKWGARIEYDLS
jgi:hypothetical protein